MLFHVFKTLNGTEIWMYTRQKHNHKGDLLPHCVWSFYLQLFCSEGRSCPFGWFWLTVLFWWHRPLQSESASCVKTRGKWLETLFRSIRLKAVCIWNTRTALSSPFQVLHHCVVMDPTKYFLLHQPELLACGQLPFAGEAGEAGQMVGIASGSPYPVAGVDLPATAGTLCTKPTVRQRRAWASILIP